MGTALVLSLFPKEGQPGWWLMENVPDAHEPTVDGYEVRSFTLNNRWVGGEQNRIRRFSFGSRNGADLRSFVTLEALEAFAVGQTVCASGSVKPGIPTGRTVRANRAKYLGWKTAEALRESIRLQGLPDDFLSEAPFTLATACRFQWGVQLPLPS